MDHITILGAGAFGFAITKVISENQTDKEVFLFDVQEDHIAHIKKTREHPIFHPDIKLADHVSATTDLEHAVKDADLIILAIPSKFLRSAIKDFKGYIKKPVIFLNLAKGLEKDTNLRVSQILEQELKDTSINYNICCLSGGMIANEVTLQNPLCADLACEDRRIAKKVAQILWSDYLHIETSDDLVGVELAGAFKNMLAIGAGIFDGQGYGESSKSGYVSEASQQIEKLAIALGARPETFGPGSQAWFGDLMTTCFGASRNRQLGGLVGKGTPVKDAVEKMVSENKSIEGYLTTDVINSLLDKHNIQAPLLKSLHSVLYNNKSPEEFIKEFIKS